MAEQPEYLTTREVAALLRIKERKVYDLAASGKIECSKSFGKLLFPRAAVTNWLAAGAVASAAPAISTRSRPVVMLGSHDPLLDWALRESGCAIASYFDGSADGLQRMAAGEGIATALHVYDPDTGQWNIPAVVEQCSGTDTVLVQWCRRDRGLVLAESAADIKSIADLAGRRVVARQAGAGAQVLLEHVLGKAGLDMAKLEVVATARTESDAAMAILEGKADAVFGLAELAARYHLGFVSIIEERVDLLVDRRAWFDASFQRFLEFCNDRVFRDHVDAMTGYDVSGLGRVVMNGPGASGQAQAYNREKL